MSSLVRVDTSGVRALAARVGAFSDQVAIIQARALNKAAEKGKAAAKRARGDAMRGIAAGRKQAGISVSVGQKGRRQMPGAFMVPRRAGTVAGGNGMGIFIRVGPGRKDIEHLYGPSVDQVFSGVIVRISAEIADDYKAEAARLTAIEMRKLNK